MAKVEAGREYTIVVLCLKRVRPPTRATSSRHLRDRRLPISGGNDLSLSEPRPDVFPGERISSRTDDLEGPVRLDLNQCSLPK
jgi:hypothetical protein